MTDYVRHMTLPSGLELPVYYKNLIFDGRMTQSRLDANGLSLPEDSRIERFSERFRDAQGKLIAGRLYNGATPIQLDGLATVIEADGRLEILESSESGRQYQHLRAGVEGRPRTAVPRSDHPAAAGRRH